MKIAIIGASRGIGYELLKTALEEGHEVTALVRNPAKLHISNPRLKIVKGDILDPASAAAVTAGQDAVCVCIGIPPTRKPVNVFSRGAELILAAMGGESHQKLIAVTGIGAGDSKGHGGFLYDRVLNPLLLGTIYADKNRQESIIKASDVEWLIVRPGFLTNGPRTGKYRAIENLSGVTAGNISRLDVADFILKQLTAPTYFGKTPLLTYQLDGLTLQPTGPAREVAPGRLLLCIPALLDFRGNILKGDLQSRTALKLVREWIDLRYAELLEDWELAKQDKTIRTINPLQ